MKEKNGYCGEFKKIKNVLAFKYDGDFIFSDGTPYVPDLAMKALNDGVFYYSETYDYPCELFINSKDGIVHVDVGNYIIKAPNGDFYVCDMEIFEDTYELVK